MLGVPRLALSDRETWSYAEGGEHTESLRNLRSMKSARITTVDGETRQEALRVIADPRTAQAMALTLACLRSDFGRRQVLSVRPRKNNNSGDSSRRERAESSDVMA